MHLESARRKYGWWDGRLWPDDGERAISAEATEPASFTANPRTSTARAIALSPLLLAAIIQFAAPAAFRAAVHGPDAMTALEDMIQSVGLLTLIAGVLVTAIFTAWCSRRDADILTHRGATDPFHWQWGTIGGLYLAGRALHLRHQHSSDLSPLLLWLLTSAISGALIIIEYTACATTSIHHTVFLDAY